MYRIAVIGGDGTGPEVVRESVKVLKKVQEKSGIKFEFTPYDFGGERYKKTGIVLDDSDIESLKQHDAVLLGAIGDPDVQPGLLERGILLKLRFALDQYINLRPVKLYENVATPLNGVKPSDIDYVVVRENTGGLYCGAGGFSMKGTPQETATQTMIYTRHQVDRCLRYAFDYAVKRHERTPWAGLTDQEKAAGYRGKLTLCGKTNVLTYTFDLWERAFKEMAAEYPGIKTDYCHVDAMCIYMIESPARFDVIVTANMFGDIITDLAASTQGGMGIAPGGNINPNGLSMFEPIGGTAPDFTGKNEINPMASIGSAAMMLDHLGESDAAAAIDSAMKSVIREMTSMAAGKMGYSTSQVGDMVADLL